MCVHTYYMRFLHYFQDGMLGFIALKCNIFENTPQDCLGACENQSSGLFLLLPFDSVKYQSGVCNRVIVDKIVK